MKAPRPAPSPALVALNSSAIEVDHAAGAGGGGALLTAKGFGAQAPARLAWMLAALLVSVWAALHPQAVHG